MAGCRWIRTRTTTMAGAALLALPLVLGAGAAKADRCDDLAKQLANQIDGLAVTKAETNQIPLKHPAFRRAALGCASRNVTNEVFATTDARKPSAAFYDTIGRAAALVFTIPLDDARRGAERCVKQIGLIRGYSRATRYRALDVRCSWNKTETMVSISRQRDR
jgi:hypothetical protein